MVPYAEACLPPGIQSTTCQHFSLRHFPPSDLIRRIQTRSLGLFYSPDPDPSHAARRRSMPTNRNGSKGPSHRTSRARLRPSTGPQRDPLQRRPEAPLGPLRRRDPRSRQENPRLARHLRHSRGSRARLRQRGASVPRRQSQDELPHALGARKQQHAQPQPEQYARLFLAAAARPHTLPALRHRRRRWRGPLSFPVARPVLFFDAFARADNMIGLGRREACGFERPAADFRRAAAQSDSDSSSVVDYDRRGLLDLDLNVPPPPEVA
ncbi:ethylene-responsive transcription factor 4 [Spatholobus suberectus]|nr:ethylene-responsive transcription factor 4 [Spatholobus suberectus]